MNQQTNLLANGGTAAGNVASYQYSSNAAAISTSQVVIHPQRGIPAMTSNRFASQGGPTSTYRVRKSEKKKPLSLARHDVLCSKAVQKHDNQYCEVIISV